MGLVTPGMLAAVRNVGNMGLESSATVMRAIQIENAFGTELQWATVATDVPCWVRSTSLAASVTMNGMREVVVGAFRIHFAAESDIDHADRILVGDETFEVIDVNLENTYTVFTTALAKKVE